MEPCTSQTLPLSALTPPPTPARLSIDHDALGALADDIAANGLLQPIGVAGPDGDGRYEIGFGHRRYLAHQLLHRPVIDCRVWPAGTPLEDVRSSENYQREQLSPVEEAHDVARRLARGESRSAIARTLRRSATWVAAREELIHFPEELQAAIHEGILSIGVARELASIDHEPYRRQLVLEAEQNGASIMTARVWRAHYERDKARIISNDMAVQEIVEARRAFVAYYPCDGCGADTVFTATRALRFCLTCDQAIRAASTAPTTEERPA